MAQPKKRQRRLSKKNTMFGKLNTNKRLLTLVPILLFAGAGAYLVFGANAQQIPSYCDEGVCVAYAPNPPLARNCGIDVLLLVDGSGSMATLPANMGGTSSFDLAREAMKSLITTLNNTEMYFALGKIDQKHAREGDYETVFGQNSAAFIADIKELESSGGSEIADLSWVAEIDPRPDRQNLIIVLTDFEIKLPGASSISKAKQSGTRILAIEVNEVGEASPAEQRSLTDFTAGPKFNTGSLLTSDVITLTPATIEQNFSELAQQLCSPPGNNGPGGGGTGNGNGTGGTGTGTNGNGQGTTGQGGGGGGSTAKKQGDQSNTIPSSSGQGNSKQPELEPSPFFDGKEFKPGSNADTLGSTVSGTGRKLVKGWYFVVGAVVLGGGAGLSYWYYRQRVRVSK